MNVIGKIRVAFIAIAAVRIAGLAMAQGPVDYSKVQIETVKLAPNFYILNGQGGAIGVLTGSDGVLLVDSQFAPLTEKIVAAIKQVAPNEPLRFLINTHVHPDHTGGNENLGKMGVIIIAREELRNRLAHPAPGANGAPGTPAPAPALPMITYDGPLTFHFDGEEVHAIPVPHAHTDGDTMVQFPNANVIMIGDFYRSIQYPNIDRNNGGSLKGMIEGIDLAIKLSNAQTKIVPGHGPVVDRAALMAHRDMIIAVRDKIAPLVAQGKSLDEVLAAKPTADYDSKVPNSDTTTQRFVTQVYQELKAGK